MGEPFDVFFVTFENELNKKGKSNWFCGNLFESRYSGFATVSLSQKVFERTNWSKIGGYSEGKIEFQFS